MSGKGRLNFTAAGPGAWRIKRGSNRVPACAVHAFVWLQLASRQRAVHMRVQGRTDLDASPIPAPGEPGPRGGGGATGAMGKSFWTPLLASP